jgi:hypothetical protein
VAAVTIAAVLAAVTAASAETVTYTFPADTNVQPFYRWTAPAGVCLATFDLYGAEGSGGVGGAHVTSTIAVKPGAPYDVYVGGWGYVGIGGYNGGGAASDPGVGGGGATDVRDGPALTDRLLVAGGGGGNGGIWNMRGPAGLGGVGALFGQDGTRSSGGASNAGDGGKGGTATAGGAGGSANPNLSGYAGHPGTLGVGGAGGDSSASGGGGGGGLYGGGGGGAGVGNDPGGGGGGGSSLTAGGTVDPNAHGGKGMAVINFEPSSNCDAAGGSPGATLQLPTGTNPKTGIARVGTRLTLKGRYALVKLQCTQVGTCRGSLSLTTTGLPSTHKTGAAKAKQTKLGSVKFTIPGLKTKTAKVKLSRTIRKGLAALSSRRLKRLKIVATAKVGGEITKFSLGATRKR